jgi:hypothetical protein
VGPSGSAFRRGLKPVRAAAVKSCGGERRIKSPRHDLGQVCVQKMSVSEPFDDAPIRFFKCRQNQECVPLLGQVRGEPDDCADGGRRIGGMSWTQASMWNCGNQCTDAKGEAQAVETARRVYRCSALGRTDL